MLTMKMVKYTCIDGWRFECPDSKCRGRYTMKTALKEYCPNNLSVYIFARIAFEYFPDGFNATTLMKKLAIFHNCEISYESTRKIL